MFGLPSSSFSCEPSQHAAWLLLNEFAYPPIHGPAGTTRFDSGALAVEPDVTNLRLTRRSAVINAPGRNETTSNAASERDVKCWVKIGAGAASGFSERRHIGVVFDANWRLYQIAQPITELEIGPPFHVMGTADFSGFPIDRSAETDSHRSQRCLRHQFSHCRRDLLANPCRPSGTVHWMTPTPDDLF